jgi:hypothetical protein
MAFGQLAWLFRDGKLPPRLGETIETQFVFDAKYQDVVARKLDEKQVKVSQLLVYPIKVRMRLGLIVTLAIYD